MKKEAEIISELRKRLEELFPVGNAHFVVDQDLVTGRYLDSLKADVLIYFSFENCRLRFVGEIVSARGSAILRNKIHRLKSIQYQRNEKPIIIADYLSKHQRKICRDEGVFYLDLMGNIFIHHNGVYIDKVSPEKPYPSERVERNPFSDKASLFLRKMLEAPSEGWLWRNLTEGTGLSPGYVSKLSKRLKELNYIKADSSGRMRLRNPKDVLEDWVRAYSYKKNEQLRYFCLAKSPDEILSKLRNAKIPEEVRYALGVQAGANLVSSYAVYNEVHIYVSNKDAIDFFVTELNLRVAEQGANLIFLLPYYKNSVFYGKQKIRSLWVVSDIQLYLDLYNYPIRGLEQAEHLYEKRLKRLIEQ